MTIARIALALALVSSACKKEEAKPAPAAAEPAPTDHAKSAESAAPGGTVAPTPPPTPAATTPAAPADVKPAGGFKTQAEYEAKGDELLGKLIDVFQKAGPNCGKLAVGINKFADDNKAAIDGSKEFESANPDAKRQLNERMKPRQADMLAKLGPSLKACGSNDGVNKALARIGDSSSQQSGEKPHP